MDLNAQGCGCAVYLFLKIYAAWGCNDHWLGSWFKPLPNWVRSWYIQLILNLTKGSYLAYTGGKHNFLSSARAWGQVPLNIAWITSCIFVFPFQIISRYHYWTRLQLFGSHMILSLAFWAIYPHWLIIDACDTFPSFRFFSFQGGFAKCFELTDLKTRKTYAGKIISKNRITKPHQREKVRMIL